MKKILVIFFVSFFAMSCKHDPHQLSVVDKHAVEVMVKKTLNDYFDDIKINGLTSEFKYLDSSAQFFWVPPGYKNSIGYDSVKIAIEKNAAKFEMIDNKWDTLMIVPLTKELATYTGIITSISIDTAGNKSQVKLIETGTMIKRDRNEWKLLCGQTNILE